MGYRHNFISSYTGLKELPEWFTEKYGDSISLFDSVLRSNHECKRYGLFVDLPQDFKKIIDSESNAHLVFYADEGDNRNHPDIAFVSIIDGKITERRAVEWVEVSLNSEPYEGCER